MLGKGKVYSVEKIKAIEEILRREISVSGALLNSSDFNNVLRELSETVRIVCLDKLTYAGNLSSLDTVRGTQRFEFIQGDICDEAVVQDIFAEKGPDVVVNFAAESHAVCGRPLPGPGFDSAWRPCRGSLQCRRRQ